MTDPPEDPDVRARAWLEGGGYGGMPPGTLAFIARHPELALQCSRAAQLRASARSYTAIAAELSLGSPNAAKRHVEAGLGLTPGEDIRALRQRAAGDLEMIRQQLRKIMPEGDTP